MVWKEVTQCFRDSWDKNSTRLLNLFSGVEFSVLFYANTA